MPNDVSYKFFFRCFLYFSDYAIFCILQKDESIHRNLIQKAYKSLLSDNEDNLVHVILRNNKKVSVNRSIFKLFSPFISSIIGDSSSDNSPVIILPDCSRKCFTSLIEILTEGTTAAKIFKNPNDEVKDIKCLAQCLGIDLSNLMLEQNLKIQPKVKESLRIKTFSHIFNYAEVPNILSYAQKRNNDEEEGMTNLNQPSPGNLLEIVSGDDEEALMDYSLMMAEDLKKLLTSRKILSILLIQDQTAEVKPQQTRPGQELGLGGVPSLTITT